MSTTVKVDRAGPVVMVDDQDEDILIARTCYSHSCLRNPLVTLTGGAELLRYMEDVEAGQVEMPALVLLDINMPAMDGFAALASLRSMEPFRLQPMVSMMTNSSSPRDEKRALELGANRFLTKPLGIAEFVRLFDSLL